MWLKKGKMERWKGLIGFIRERFPPHGPEEVARYNLDGNKP